eukprot:1158352-Pelagomonas_calceolata.AAC.4
MCSLQHASASPAQIGLIRKLPIFWGGGRLLVKELPILYPWVYVLVHAADPDPDKVDLETALPKPDEEEIERVAAETQAALDRVVQGKQAAVNPATLPNQPGGPQYIK